MATVTQELNRHSLTLIITSLTHAHCTSVPMPGEFPTMPSDSSMKAITACIQCSAFSLLSAGLISLTPCLSFGHSRSVVSHVQGGRYLCSPPSPGILGELLAHPARAAVKPTHST